MRNNVISAVLGVVLVTCANGAAVSGASSNSEILVRDNSCFAIDLYRKLCRPGTNTFFSPYSISCAMAMTYAGARGDTEKQMAKVLNFSLKQKEVHDAFAKLRSELKSIGKNGKVELVAANSIWPQREYKFLDEYLSLLKNYYGVSVTPLDYGNSEAARKTINSWVEEQTKDRIKNLITPGILTPLTRLVLVNAIYFKGDWESPFDAKYTKKSPFYVSHAKTVQVPMMMQKHKFRYAEIEKFQMLELHYAGGELSMIVLLSRQGVALSVLENSLSVENIRRWQRKLRKQQVLLYLPKFKVTCAVRLDDTLKSMGMAAAFDRLKADFSGMDGHLHWLYIDAVLHKAFIEVDEKGTEAAASTAVAMAFKSMPERPVTFRVDHPFVFLICDRRSSNILFMGTMVDPPRAQ